jgi:hypothetical protein
VNAIFGLREGGICLAHGVGMSRSLVPVARITHAILVCRRQKVLLDHDLAALYGVETKALNQAVRRNLRRFPSDFMFQLNAREVAILRSQSVTSRSHGGRRTRPYAFTEQGLAMLSSVLGSQRAIGVNIEIMRAFVKLRRVLQSHADLARKLDSLEQRYDGQFAAVFDAIRRLMTPESPPARRIGFQAQRTGHVGGDIPHPRDDASRRAGSPSRSPATERARQRRIDAS